MPHVVRCEVCCFFKERLFGKGTWYNEELASEGVLHEFESRRRCDGQSRLHFTASRCRSRESTTATISSPTDIFTDLRLTADT